MQWNPQSVLAEVATKGRLGAPRGSLSTAETNKQAMCTGGGQSRETGGRKLLSILPSTAEGLKKDETEHPAEGCPSP